MSQFTVEHIWPLDPTKKNGGFKGADGVNYYCETGAYGLLTKGATYDAPVSPYVSKAGKQSFIVDKKWHPPATLVGNGQHDARHLDRPQQYSDAPPTMSQPLPPQPRSMAASGGNFGPDKSGEMFVMGVVGRAMGSGQFAVTDVKLLALAAVEAWHVVKVKL